MFKQCDASEHYKMYKKGKSWVFAGILTTFCLVTVGGTEVVHADTVADPAADSSQQTIKDQKPANQVTLKSSKPTSPTPEVKDAETPITERPESEQPESERPATDEQTPETLAPAPEGQEPDSQEPQSDGQLENAPADSSDVQDDKDQAIVNDGAEDAGAQPGTQSEQPVSNQRSPKLRLAKAPSTPQPVVAVPEDESVAVTADQSIDEWMPNKRLQSMVLWTLNNSDLGRTWASASEITKDDMLLLTTLSTTNGRFSAETWISTHIDGKTSFSLEGLQYATNLTSLDLINNLNIGEGWYYGDITDISPLRALTKLTYLQLSSNRVTDISPIAGLKNLVGLQVPYNCISDFSSLNAAQYTQVLTFNNQLIINDPVVVDGQTRTYTTPITVKLPQNYGDTLTAGEGYGWERYTRNEFYEFLPAGTATEDGQGNVVYTDLPDQVMPGRTHDDDGLVNHQQPYQRYMSRGYTVKGQINVFEVYTPYTIAAKAAAITVHYQDAAGQQIADDLVLPEGMVGDDYTTSPLTITGYQLKTTPANATGTYSDQAIDIVYVYDETTSSVTIHYQDTAGQSLLADKMITGQVGSDYVVTYPEITGYTYSRTDGQATGVYADSPTEITFIYSKNAVTPPITPPVTPTTEVTVTVHYQTADGTPVSPDVVITGHAGDGYQTQPAATVPAGYQLVTTPVNATGVMGTTNADVTYIYAVPTTGGDGDQIAPEPDRPTTQVDKPQTGKPSQTTPTAVTTTQKGGQAAKLATGKSVRTATQKGQADQVKLTRPQASAKGVTKVKSDLPQTNNEESASPLWGLVVLGALLGLVGFRKKQH
ncbi:MucBP domain-containing protein [Levilactobacillus angrenensis]|uniref:MucBP domain-containing protein n=1 Tax=Levilactobacillus angrenensis TaxID=2486020 RepID=A0ABW1UCL8_9LACO|nr:MucBP domain-containing protein [Levilactobacillus angrenensis]